MASNIVEYTVSELAFALKRTIEDSYGLVRVRGELSGFKRAASGHCYFALKDDRAVLDAVLWRGSAVRLGFAPEDGLEVVCTGRLTTYPGRSRYQLVVEEMAPAGIGALMALLEERRRRLAAEGLFDAARKRPLPFLPEVVGVVTSPTGAVIRDILHRLADRFPRRVILWPVPVQGEGAAEQVAAAIAGMGALDRAGEPPRPDVLIVARGGGSIEDLWAFNEEAVVRAVAGSPIPVIAAVGHETDTTLIDLVADRRAPTPTAAAEMAVPVRRELLQRLDGLAERLGRGVATLLDGLAERVAGLARGLPEPRLLVAHAAQRLDDVGERLFQALRARLALLTARLERARGAMRPPAALLREAELRLAQEARRLGDLVRDRLRASGRDLATACARLLAVPRDERLRLARQRLETDAARLEHAAGRRLEDAATGLGRLARLLDSLSPTQVLDRGYAIVRATSGAILPTLAAALPHRDLVVHFADGRLPVRQTGGAAGGRAPNATSRAKQGELL